MANRPRIRVALAQLDYHPATLVDGRSPREDPLFDADEPSSLRWPGLKLPREQRAVLRTLERRVARVHDRQLALKLEAIVRHCRRWRVQLLVLPESSVPAELLPGLAAAAGEMMIVAGSHLAGQGSPADPNANVRVYEQLGWHEDPTAWMGRSVAPVLHRGRLVHLQPARFGADDDLPPSVFRPTPLPIPGLGDFGVLFHRDHSRDPGWRQTLAGSQDRCRLFAVLSYAPRSRSERPPQLAYLATSLRRPALIAANADCGGTLISAGQGLGDAPLERLSRSDEALLVHDLEIDHETGEAISQPIATPSLVYRAHPIADEYAQWCADFERQLASATEDDLLTLIAACAAARSLLLGAGALVEGGRRDLRLRRLLDEDRPVLSLEHLGALTREVVLPGEALPVPALRASMGLAALRELRSWVRSDHAENVARAKRWLACAEYLAVRLDLVPHRDVEMPTPDLWSAAGLGALAKISAAIVSTHRDLADDLAASESASEDIDDDDDCDDDVDVDDDPNAHFYGDSGGLYLSSTMPRSDVQESPKVEQGARGLDLQGADEELEELDAPASFAAPSGVRRRQHAAPTPTPDASITEFERVLQAAVWNTLPRSKTLSDTDEKFEPPSAITPDSRTVRSALDLLEASSTATPSVCLLLGPAGFGKSTLLGRWAAQRWISKADPQPIIVPLRRRVDHTHPLDLLFETVGFFDATEVHRQLLRRWIDDRRLIPCFDDFDELASAQQPLLLERMLELTDGGGQIFIASDPSLFAAGSEAATLVDRTAGGAATRILLQPFSPAQVTNLVAKVATSEREKTSILERLAAVYDIDVLIQQPLLLGMVLQGLERLDPTTRVTAADIYEGHLSTWQGHADALPAPLLRAEERATLLEALALAIWDLRTSPCTLDGLRFAFLRDLAPTLANLTDDGLGEAIRTSLPGGLVDGDPRRGFWFTHTSYVEFFVARALIRHLDATPRLLAIRPLNAPITSFVPQLLRREGGSQKILSWLQTLETWVRYEPPGSSPSWHLNVRTLLDCLLETPRGETNTAIERGHEERPERAQGTRSGAEYAPSEESEESEESDAYSDKLSPGARRPESDEERTREEPDEVELSGGVEAVPKRTPLEAPRPSEALAFAEDTPSPLVPAPRSSETAERPAAKPAAPAPSATPNASGLEPSTPPAGPQTYAPLVPRPVAPAPAQQALARPSLKKEHLLAKASLLSKRAPQARAPNRFLPGRPLADPNLPGREDILRELSTLLSLPSPALLKGPRRSGKTSILHALAGHAGSERTITRTTLEGRTLREPDDLARVLAPELGDARSPADKLWRQLSATRDHAPPPAFLLDELAWLGEGSDQLFAWLRALGQEGLAAIVLAGSHSDWIELIKRANRMPGSSFGNDYTVIELGPLREEEAIRFLVVTAPDDVELHPERTARWIVELCGCWPFYLQVMGYAVVEEVRSGRHGALVRKEALHDLYQRRLLVERVAVFRSRWGDLRAPAQLLLLEELERARHRGSLELTPYRDLPRASRPILSDADLIDAVAGWKIDRPFKDWLFRNLDELEPTHG